MTQIQEDLTREEYYLTHEDSDSLSVQTLGSASTIGLLFLENISALKKHKAHLFFFFLTWFRTHLSSYGVM